MAVYYDFLRTDDTPISVELYTDNESVERHKHKCQEFVMVTKGSCIHNYKGQKAVLIPGDVFIVPPHQVHSYDIYNKVEIYNCQFFPLQTTSDLQELTHNIHSHPASYRDIATQYDSLIKQVMLGSENDIPKYDTDLNAQGIIHLPPQEMAQVEYYLKMMLQEQENQKDGVEYVKSSLLQLILVILKRTRSQQSFELESYSLKQRESIIEILEYIDSHIAERIYVDDLAEQVHLSSSYFRSMFKSVTGLSPVDYINRLRIVKSLKYLQADNLNISDAAARVGIYDPNYFSRLFKKIMGAPPSYFVNV